MNHCIEEREYGVLGNGIGLVGHVIISANYKFKRLSSCFDEYHSSD